MTTSTANGCVNHSTSLREEKYQAFDWRKYNPRESWDDFILRKMREERDVER